MKKNDSTGMNYIAVDLLKNKGLHIATAESCTGGAVAKLITDVPGASSVFECGVVCYSNAVKADVLGVSETLLKEQGAVCAEVAAQLAEGVRRLGKADAGIGITGMAGPTSDEDGKPVGLIYLALSDGRNIYPCTLNTGDSAQGCRDRNRERAVEAAFKLIADYAE